MKSCLINLWGWSTCTVTPWCSSNAQAVDIWHRLRLLCLLLQIALPAFFLTNNHGSSCCEFEFENSYKNIAKGTTDPGVDCFNQINSSQKLKKADITQSPRSEDNLTPRTIWHLGQFDTIMQNRTIWHHHTKKGQFDTVKNFHQQF